MKLITFITRISRETNVQAIYNSIKNNFNDYYWLVYIEKDTIKIPQKLIQIANIDNNVIINNNIKRQSTLDRVFNEGVQHGFNSEYAKNSKWIYVIDDDNIAHDNLKNVIQKANDNVELIISPIVDNRPGSPIQSGKNLTVNHCYGFVDWANSVFSSKFFQEKIHHTNVTTLGQDGELVKSYIINNANIFYTNEIAGYYNFLSQ